MKTIFFYTMAAVCGLLTVVMYFSPAVPAAGVVVGLVATALCASYKVVLGK